MVAVETHTFLKIYWKSFNLLGAIEPTRSWLYLIYCIALQIFVTIGYPLHLIMSILRNDSTGQNIQNLAVSVTCIACALKFTHNALRQRSVRDLQLIMAELDARATSREEQQYYWQVRKNVRQIEHCFLGIYFTIGVTAELMFLFHTERVLLYPAYFPFDWRGSTWKFYAAHLYQILGISVLLIQNLGNDFMPPAMLAILAGHIKFLGMRVAHIGYDNPQDPKLNEAELVHCIKDQQNLYRMFDGIQSLISIPMFVQLAVAAFNICLVFAAVLFYVNGPFERAYYVSYLIAMPLQIFPSCYYGTYSETLFEQLHTKMYESNWIEQTQTFRKFMFLFCERAQKKQTIMAGGLVRMHLNTFLSTVRAAYSLLAVVMKMDGVPAASPEQPWCNRYPEID